MTMTKVSTPNTATEMMTAVLVSWEPETETKRNHDIGSYCTIDQQMTDPYVLFHHLLCLRAICKTL